MSNNEGKQLEEMTFFFFYSYSPVSLEATDTCITNSLILMKDDSNIYYKFITIHYTTITLRVVSCVYLRLLTFLPAILIPAGDSSSPIST